MALLKHKPRPLPLLISLVAFCTCVVFGTWQIQRLIWKENLIERIETANAQAPLQALPPAEELEQYHYYFVNLTGEYLHEHELHLAARYHNSVLGYSILTPMALADGRIVMINRGWVPSDKKELETRPDSQPDGTREITAMIRLNHERNPFTPPNQPERNVWFGRDVDEMAAYTELDLEPLTLDRIGEQMEGFLPVPATGEVNLRNDHLSYVITWYLIAAGIAAIFITYHRKES